MSAANDDACDAAYNRATLALSHLRRGVNMLNVETVDLEGASEKRIADALPRLYFLQASCELHASAMHAALEELWDAMKGKPDAGKAGQP